MRINACYQPRAIPGSDKLLFVAGAHHADVGGSLVLLDPRRVGSIRKTGEDRFDSIEVLTPEVCFPESAGWPKSYFHSPWPLSEDCFLVSFSFDPLPGMSSGEKQGHADGAVLLRPLRQPGTALPRPGHLQHVSDSAGAAAARRRSWRPTLDPALGDEGEFLLADVRRSLFPMPAGRAIRELRVFQVLPKTAPHTANEPRIGHANAESARMLLGTVPVEADGSAYFRAPAGKPLYFQAVDDRAAPCRACAARPTCSPANAAAASAATNRPAAPPPAGPRWPCGARLRASSPGPEGSRPFSFPLLVQPVLDRHCVRCHDGQDGPGQEQAGPDRRAGEDLLARPTRT